VLVYEYHPTRAFAHQYSSRPDRAWTLARCRIPAAELPSLLRAGDRLVVPAVTPPDSRAPALRGRVDRFVADRRELLAERFALAGIDLWDVVGEHLLRAVERYGAYIERAAPLFRRQLERLGVDAILVPFDTPPEPRLLVRLGQAMGIPTFVLNNGFLGDDHHAECMTADVGLAWSESLARRYFSRRPQDRTVVTGNPRADRPPPRVDRATGGGVPRRVLVGSFSFSPADLGCRRADPERFMEGVLEGIDRAGAGPEVVVKLHPADSTGYYRDVLAHFPRLSVRVVDRGDVLDMLSDCDVYITTYSTSIIEAAAAGVPVVYYRANEQVLHPPFSGDDFLERRTASSPEEVSGLLRDRGVMRMDAEAATAWAERYLGPLDGHSSERVADAIATVLEPGSGPAEHARGHAGHDHAVLDVADHDRP
jgi:hypothetical protein